MTDPIKKLSEIVIKKFYDHTHDHVFTVAISGIDASGKGYVAKRLEGELTRKGLNVANINVDPWQNPIPIRLNRENPAENFYHKVFRWDDLFTQLIVPLKKRGGVCLNTMLIRTDADEYYPHIYNFRDLNILLFEGIFLFKKTLLPYYDWKIWIDCSFERGLQRAIIRNSENLSKEQLVHDYNTHYYPAQRYHFQQDNPRKLCDIIYCNDELLGTVGQLTVKSSQEI